MLDEIRKILADFTEVPSDSITEKTKFKNDLGLNSLDVVNIVMAFEDAFGVAIEDEDIPGLLTVGDAITYIKSKQS